MMRGTTAARWSLLVVVLLMLSGCVLQDEQARSSDAFATPSSFDVELSHSNVQGWESRYGEDYIEMIAEDGSCSFVMSVDYEPSYRAGRGDSYLSHETAYAMTSFSTTRPSDATTLNLGGEIEMVAIAYTFDNAIAEDGDGVVVTDGEVYGTVLVRTFDILVDLPEEHIEDVAYVGYETDTTKGLPSLSGMVQCINAPLEEERIQELLDSVGVSGIDFDTQ